MNWLRIIGMVACALGGLWFLLGWLADSNVARSLNDDANSEAARATAPDMFGRPLDPDARDQYLRRADNSRKQVPEFLINARNNAITAGVLFVAFLGLATWQVVSSLSASPVLAQDSPPTAPQT